MRGFHINLLKKLAVSFRVELWTVVAANAATNSAKAHQPGQQFNELIAGETTSRFKDKALTSVLFDNRTEETRRQV